MSGNPWLGRRVAVAGDGPEADDLAEEIVRFSEVKLAGVLSWSEGGSGGGRRRVASLDDVRAGKWLAMDNLILAPGPGQAADEAVTDLMNACEAAGVGLYAPEGFFKDMVGAPEEVVLLGRRLARLRDARLGPVYAVVKRVMDVVVAAAGLALGAPLWLAIAAVIRWQGHGPVFFAQKRAGLHGRLFRIYKFSTMIANAEDHLPGLVDLDNMALPGFKMANDPRVTPFGRLLRRTGLDEAPQLWNILKGDMSLVGPRPEIARFVRRYSARQRRRLKAKPGLTGLQQVEARGTPLAAGVDYDLAYMGRQTLWGDLAILWRTVGVVVRGEGVA